jgi:hypothetical protein
LNEKITNLTKLLEEKDKEIQDLQHQLNLLKQDTKSSRPIKPKQPYLKVQSKAKRKKN